MTDETEEDHIHYTKVCDKHGYCVMKIVAKDQTSKDEEQVGFEPPRSKAIDIPKVIPIHSASKHDKNRRQKSRRSILIESTELTLSEIDDYDDEEILMK
jgi:hypothetical protein